MDIRGWVHTSVVDYPEHIATVLFVGGCQWRCPMCHNRDLVLQPSLLPSISEDDITAYLVRRKGLVSGIVITGGEPTLQRDLLPFLRRIRPLGLHIKLDTNGYQPEVLAPILWEGLVDYVAMDVKAPPRLYPQVCGQATLDINRLECSLALLATGGVSYELRTTVVPGLIDATEIREILDWVVIAPPFVLQQFRPDRTLDSSLQYRQPYPPAYLRQIAAEMQPTIGRVEVRA
ncbi:MAG: anaerobic ribonucleoside-triphosphate reductase activating protein [Anaerolineae bacterium]